MKEKTTSRPYPISESDENKVAEYSESLYTPQTVKDLPPDEQPREKALKYGIGSLSNAELFAIILRTGTTGYPITEVCRDMMRMNENLILNLERKTRSQLTEMKGIGETKALQIEAVMEIVRRYNREQIGERIQVKASRTVFDIMKPEIANLPYEEMWVLFLNRSNRIISKLRISQGGSTSTVFDVKKVVRNALYAHAESIVLCHNHPSGNIRPSGADDAVTKSCHEACKSMDIKLLDHVILTTDSFYSYNDSSTLLK